MRYALFVAFLISALQVRAGGGRDFFFELSPLYFFHEGGGGSIGVESGHWQHGFAFNTFNPDNFVLGGKVDISSSFTTLRTTNFEPYTKFYFSKERKWVYIGLNFSPELYLLQSDSTGLQSFSFNVFANPKLGMRWFPFKRYLYVDASYGLSLLFFDGESKKFIKPSVDLSDLAGRPELSVGLRF